MPHDLHLVRDELPQELRAARARLLRAALLFTGPGATEHELIEAAREYGRVCVPPTWLHPGHVPGCEGET